MTGDAAWEELSTPALHWYNKDEQSFKNSYRALYNRYAVNSGKLAPMGWHVPSDSEWTVLTDYHGGEGAGGKMKKPV